VRKGGIHLTSALRFLDLTSLSPSLERIDVLAALVSLPVSTHTDKNAALEFSELILEILVSRDSSELTKGWIENALDCLCLILRTFWQGSKRDTGTAFLRKLFGCRSKCFQWNTSRDLWLQCLQQVTPTMNGDDGATMDEGPAGDDLAVLAKEILSNHSCEGIPQHHS
jgi:hypothetical protein